MTFLSCLDCCLLTSNSVGEYVMFYFGRNERNPAGTENRKINFQRRLMMKAPVNNKDPGSGQCYTGRKLHIKCCSSNASHCINSQEIFSPF